MATDLHGCKHKTNTQTQGKHTDTQTHIQTKTHGDIRKQTHKHTTNNKTRHNQGTHHAIARKNCGGHHPHRNTAELTTELISEDRATTTSVLSETRLQNMATEI